MGRSPSSTDGMALKKGPWMPEEDHILVDYIRQHGHGSWRSLPKRAGLNRCGKSCRLRWNNYLRPDIKRGKFSGEEDQAIIDLHSVLGNKWSKIAAHLPGRTDNEIKNYWNTHLRKKLLRGGIDPKTHKPVPDFNQLANLSQLLSATNFANLMNPWHNNAFIPQGAVDATTQLAKVQLLQSIMQVINTSLPNVAERSPSGLLHNFAQFDLPQTPFHFPSIPAIGNYPMTCFQHFQQGLDISYEHIDSKNCTRSENYGLPALVSASMESNATDNTELESQLISPTSNVFEALDKFLHDEANWPWNDVLE